ncbi:MAG: hypothetical protein IPP57_06565 [Candidatus Obscuribacter sp.]|jgi:ribosome maturation factor RimP|nr:hypothetical protein [Candidatus Obscuribacter sp.]MBK7840571.1 hypothetical protein [Candidatus Obscuribacter sp.]MBK9201770.1 hypothetical protein [Candidatus Obscuribacter sp.]MBK9620061.1 hypothetical protein [Candidatus Obscuribacter sp.]MBK9770474.1 hypothetical protein [Candidatus Obscuribacter sp.]
MPNSKSPEQALQMITKAAEEVAAKLGFVLVDAHFGQQGRKTSLEVSIHKPGGRVGLSDCESVSRELDAKLESLTELPALLHGAYVLDVCSPGLERVLKSEREYNIFAGSLVEVKTKSDVGAGAFGQHFLATLGGANGDKLILTKLQEVPKVGGKANGKANSKSKSKQGKMPAPEPVNELKVATKSITQIKLYVDLSKVAEAKAINLDQEALEPQEDQELVDE